MIKLTITVDKGKSSDTHKHWIHLWVEPCHHENEKITYNLYILFIIGQKFFDVLHALLIIHFPRLKFILIVSKILERS